MMCRSRGTLFRLRQKTIRLESGQPPRRAASHLRVLSRIRPLKWDTMEGNSEETMFVELTKSIYSSEVVK